MQLVRQGLNVRGDPRNLFKEFAHAASHIGQNERILVKLLQLDGKQGETLTDVVVKFPANPAAFLLLCLNQPAGNFQKRLLNLLAAGNVLSKDENSSYIPAGCLPWTDFPTKPSSKP